MTLGRVGPSFDGEVMHDSRRARVARVHLDGRTLIRKEPLGPGAEARLRTEVTILERLRGVRGAAQLHDRASGEGFLLLEDAGGTTLADLPKPVAGDALVGFAVQLARAVAAVHARGVIHRDINPSNVVISGEGDLCLVDFAVATRFAEIHPPFGPHSEIPGTLAYIAPEQTGRTGRSVDHRADLYALGATLYELAVGEAPFGSGAPLQLVHDHLARTPAPPAEVNPTVPGLLSEIVMRLLEKEPDRRYQTAEGVAHDLELLRVGGPAGQAATVRLGERDVPLRLLPPSRLVGRQRELAALEAAFADALAGRCRAVHVHGASGVGKTALIDQLRPVASRGGGWFVAGKFDQYRADLESDAVNQAVRALGRLLLAEPDAELAEARRRIKDLAGANVGLLAGAAPEFGTLLGVAPDAGDPLTAQERAARAGVALLRAVASRRRPLVLILDDLQWARSTPLRFIELLLSEEPIDGLLLVGAYREGDVDAAHPLAARLERWRRQADVQHVGLENLATPDVADMVGEMLAIDPPPGLVELIAQHTHGNPYEIVELLNALRTDGVLTSSNAGWSLDAAAVRGHLERSNPEALLLARIEAMPPESRRLAEAMACLGGRAEARLLEVAVDQPASSVEHALTAALEEGVLVAEPGVRPAVRFRHDRTRDAILGSLGARERGDLQLAMARRLAAVPELFAVAAEQYLPAVGDIAEARERQRTAALLQRAADQAALIGDWALVDRFLSAAVRLIDPADTAALAEIHRARHAALFSLGRLEEGDQDYEQIERLTATALERAGATTVQLFSLANRTRFADATTLGLTTLRGLGIDVPPTHALAAELDHQFEVLYRWLDAEPADDLARPDITEPRLLAATSVINALVPAAYYEPALYTWLALEALRIWVVHGPGATVIGPAGHAAFAAVLLRGDYAAADRTARRLVAVGEARGYEPGTSQTRQVLAVHGWIAEPIENLIPAAERAREGLVAGADLGYASYTYYPTAAALLDCAPSLDGVVAEVRAGQAFAARIGSDQITQWLESYGWLARVLRGESADPDGEAAMFDAYGDNPVALFLSHVNRALAAALFDDAPGLARHSAAAMPLLPAGASLYTNGLARLLRGLSLANEARSGDPPPELDAMIQWLAARAADAPDNFLHLLHLLEAERASAASDFRAAVTAFDAASRAAAERRRPWHRALIAERAARFHRANGVDQIASIFLAQARREYLSWGATAKVAQLDWAFPATPPPAPTDTGDAQRTGEPAPVTSGAIDLLGILSASQALSSETSIERLQARVTEVLSALTGATGIRLVSWDEDRQEWMLPAPSGGDGADSAHAVPVSVLRYVQRVREPLVVTDATADDRFADDPHFAGQDLCSLLAVPILSGGRLRAVLLLENHLMRDAFTTDRLDTVRLIAAQLAVSLDNARLYADLTASRTRILTSGAEMRRQIVRDLHDGAQAGLVHTIFTLHLACRHLDAGDHDAARAMTVEALGHAERSNEDLRRLAQGILPSALARDGLAAAVEELISRQQVPVTAEVLADRMSPEVEATAYFVIAEALTNVAKHSRAQRVEVRAWTDDGTLRLRVHDDGVGGAGATGSGLTGLADRVAALGGRLSLDSPPGEGTRVFATLPLPEARSPSRPPGNALSQP